MLLYVSRLTSTFIVTHLSLCALAVEPISDADNVAVLQVTAHVNTTALLECRTTIRNDVDWRYQPAPGTHVEQSRIYQTGVVFENYADRFSVASVSDNVYQLIIGNVEYKDSGVYVCIERDGLGQKHYIQLNVTEKPRMIGKADSGRQGFLIGVTVTGLMFGAVIFTIFLIWFIRCRRVPMASDYNPLTNGNKSGASSNTTLNQIQLLTQPTADEMSKIELPASTDHQQQHHYRQLQQSNHPVKKTTIADNIQRKRKQLEYFIEFEELIAELTNRHLLTPRQTLEACKKPTAYDQIRLVLDFVADFSEEKCEQFLSVLENERVNQKHVANFIRSDADVETVYGDIRPLDEDLMAYLYANILHADNRILDFRVVVAEMERVHSITPSQRRYVDGGHDEKEKHERLVEILTRRSVADYHVFIDFLRQRQPLLAKLLLGEFEGTDHVDLISGSASDTLRFTYEVNVDNTSNIDAAAAAAAAAAGNEDNKSLLRAYDEIDAPSIGDKRLSSSSTSPSVPSKSPAAASTASHVGSSSASVPSTPASAAVAAAALANAGVITTLTRRFQRRRSSNDRKSSAAFIQLFNDTNIRKSLQVELCGSSEPDITVCLDE